MLIAFAAVSIVREVVRCFAVITISIVIGGKGNGKPVRTRYCPRNGKRVTTNLKATASDVGRRFAGMNHALVSPETGLTLETCEHRGGRLVRC